MNSRMKISRAGAVPPEKSAAWRWGSPAASGRGCRGTRSHSSRSRTAAPPRPPPPGEASRTRGRSSYAPSAPSSGLSPYSSVFGSGHFAASCFPSSIPAFPAGLPPRLSIPLCHRAAGERNPFLFPTGTRSSPAGTFLPPARALPTGQRLWTFGGPCCTIASIVQGRNSS